MDDRLVAATLAAAVLAKTDVPPGRDVAALAVKTYQRLLNGVAKVHAEKEPSAASAAPVAAKPPVPAVAAVPSPAKPAAAAKAWPPRKPTPA